MALLPGAARRVRGNVHRRKVNVHVDATREDEETGSVYLTAAGGRTPQSSDLAGVDGDVGDALGRGRDHGPASNHEVVHFRQSAPARINSLTMRT